MNVHSGAASLCLVSVAQLGRAPDCGSGRRGFESRRSPQPLMQRFAQTCDAVAATPRTKEKVRLVGEYLRDLPAHDAALAAVFFTGRPFPRIEERVLGTGGSLIWQVLGRLASSGAESFESIYRKHGDLGAMAEEILAGQGTGAPLSLADALAAFDKLAASRGAAEKLIALQELLRRAAPVEAKYIVKIITGDLRIGLKESLVELAIAHAFAKPPEQVQRANMLTGDIGATLRLAAADKLSEAHLSLFHPIGFMLASAAETAAEAMEYFSEGAQVEDKYDGIRAQAHKSGEHARLFSRTLDAIGEFPELLAPLSALPGEFILDGEIIGWRDGRPLQVGRLAAKALLERGERQRTPVAPSDDLAVQDELTRQSGKGREELRKLADRVERTREEPRVLARLVRLSANPVVFVFDLCALGEVLHRLGGGLRGARQHESDGMEQREMRLAEFVWGSEADGCANVAGEHVGALHLLWRLRKGVRDGQFNETHFETDAQVAGDDLDDVLRLDRCRASQQFLERDQLLCRASTRRQLVKRSKCVGERQRSSSSLPRQNLFRHRAEVAVLPVDGLEALGAGTCEAAQHLPDQGSAGSKNPLFDARERAPGEEDRGERRVVRWQVAEILAHQAYLLLSARGRGDSVAGLSKALHERLG